MSGQRSAWIGRRGQAGAAAAIDQVIDRSPQPGEQIQQVPDALVEDSPYQARQPFDDASVEDLAQGMREVGFQGVLIVRLHTEPTKQRRGVLQLVYGHRRRAAWRRVCGERGEPCVLPVVVRAVSDERMLTIGAQENLQRQDLDPVEEAQDAAATPRRRDTSAAECHLHATTGVACVSGAEGLPMGHDDKFRAMINAVDH